jgi:hypothetical protein
MSEFDTRIYSWLNDFLPFNVNVCFNMSYLKLDLLIIYIIFIVINFVLDRKKSYNTYYELEIISEHGAAAESRNIV